MILGYRLRSLRRQKAMSQSDLGKLLGVSKVSVSGYENGNRIPSIEVFIQILNVFETSADYLLGREVNVVCEKDNDIQIQLATDDINIINELRSKPSLYSKIAVDPKRFFNAIDKNNI